MLAKGLVPPDLESYFDGLRTALISGLPTLRNRMAAHGQGAVPKPIEEHMVTLAAATIRFLVEAHKAKDTCSRSTPMTNEGQATLAELLALLPGFRMVVLWEEDVLLENRARQ